MTRAIPVGLSTASVWPQPAEAAFALAGALGYDGVEVMVWADPASQDPLQLKRLSERYTVPVLAIHAPCLLITQRIWSPDPAVRLRRATEVARELNARTVVIHPPFVWQLRYSQRFADLIGEYEDVSGVAIAVENMFPVHPLGRSRRSIPVFTPSPDPTDVGYRNYTLDVSHAAASRMDALELAGRMGTALTHVHLADGRGVPRDEHLVPGRGSQPCGQLCESLVTGGFDGQVVLEVNTRRARDPAHRAKDLAEALLFARRHLGG